MTGVLVSKINPLSDAHRVLKKDDIILAFDGVPIANDGTGTHFPFFPSLFGGNAVLKLSFWSRYPEVVIIDIVKGLQCSYGWIPCSTNQAMNFIVKCGAY